MPFLIAILSIILIYFAFGFIIFYSAFHRKKDFNWLSVDSLKKTPWKPFANDIPNHFKWIEENNAKDVSITSFDGTILKGKWIENKNAKATVIVMHGYKGHYASDYGLVLNVYKSLGFNILMFRQRAHGESGGKYITFGAKEHKDLLSIIDYHNKTYGENPIFVSGLSMGASTVLYASNKDLPISYPFAFKNVNAIPPPINILSALVTKFSITPILSATLAPPKITTNGWSGLSNTLNAFSILSQGVPFFHAGEEMLPGKMDSSARAECDRRRPSRRAPWASPGPRRVSIP
mgnify:CR=1 FL=1